MHCFELDTLKVGKIEIFQSAEHLCKYNFVWTKCFILSYALNLFHQNLEAADLAQVIENVYHLTYFEKRICWVNQLDQVYFLSGWIFIFT